MNRVHLLLHILVNDLSPILNVFAGIPVWHTLKQPVDNGDLHLCAAADALYSCALSGISPAIDKYAYH